MNTLFRKISLVSISLLSVHSIYGQIKTTNDTVIKNGLKLCCYEQWEEWSVEKFVNKSVDLIPQMEINDYEQVPLPLRFKKYFFCDAISIFINADSTEMLLASQGHGLYYGKYEAFCIVYINDENKYILKSPLCVHTEYKHFVSEGGCRIGMTKKKLRSIRGSDYVVLEDGHWKYSYMTEEALADPKYVEYCKQTGDGDLSWEFFFDGEKVVCIIIGSYL